MMEWKYKFFYHIYFSLSRLKRSGNRIVFKIQKKYLFWFYYWCNREFVKYLKEKGSKCGINIEKRSVPLVVSLTSFPARINTTWIAIETIMRQTYRPDRIVLWLAESQFPDHVIPESLIQLQKKGLEVRFCEDLRSHKKYYYSFQEFKDSLVVTVDDDLFHPLDMIEKLMKLHKRHPDDIIASTVQIITPTMQSLPTEWKQQDNYRKYISCKEAQAFTGAGTLFPANSFPKKTYDIGSIKQNAWTCDDLWLKAASLYAGIKTTAVSPYRAFGIEIAIDNNETLYAINGADGGNQNNISWNKLIKHFDIRE